MRVIFTKLIIISLLALGWLSRLNSSEAQQINLNLNRSFSSIADLGPTFPISQPKARLNDRAFPVTGSVIVNSNSPYKIAPIDLRVNSFGAERRKKADYSGVYGGVIGFAVGFVIGSAVYQSETMFVVGGLVLAIPGTIIGVKLASDNKRRPKKRK